ncbi:hypothetical protein SCLCIDRAFT_22391 [Scleroderma citrinum Foug A]|uniref:Uncharacterized protein n=1 Tax=Scleroderma citrinum Foug A TaxID=1036808 RepID=A0A0C3DZ43_9AGAM|nr:hypothetical protein SCLCIDRAFT_22391 [Scleroderma citrinum Foug A]
MPAQQCRNFEGDVWPDGDVDGIQSRDQVNLRSLADVSNGAKLDTVATPDIPDCIRDTYTVTSDKIS